MKNIKLKTLGAVCIITGSLLIPLATQAATIEDLSTDLVDLEKNYHFDIKRKAHRNEAGVYSNISKDNFSLRAEFGKVTSKKETGTEKSISEKILFTILVLLHMSITPLISLKK